MRVSELAELLHPWTCDGVMFAHYGPAKKCERAAQEVHDALDHRRETDAAE